MFEVYFLWNRTVRAISLCVAECDKDVRCASVTYTNINNECQGHSLTFGLKGQHAVNMAGTRYFVLPHGTFVSSMTSCIGSYKIMVFQLHVRGFFKHKIKLMSLAEFIQYFIYYTFPCFNDCP